MVVHAELGEGKNSTAVYVTLINTRDLYEVDLGRILFTPGFRVFVLHRGTSGTPVQAHVADSDRFAPPDQIAAFRASAEHVGADVSLHTYPGAGHFYIDPSLPDYDPIATNRTWQHVDGLLKKARRRESR